VLEADPPFRPIRRRDGYLALEDLGLIGDGTTSALVGLDGSIPWLCLPRFDSEPLFCGLLDAAGGGSFTVAPDEVIDARQRYEPDTAVLVTELRCPRLYGGWAVNRYGPDGSLRDTVQIPVAQVTSCAFGGPGRERFEEAALEQQPDAGRVFSVTGLGARGPGSARYRGRIPT
jgi:Trehalase-like, N-terminal/SMP-30/Gluconolactonase/LRE-like region